MTEAVFPVAFLVGLLGFAHCAGMCGGLSAALCLGGGERRGLAFLLAYNAGRVATYTGLGAVGAYLSGTLFFSPWFAVGGRWLVLGADILVIILGLGGLGVLPGLSPTLSAPSAFARFLAKVTGMTAGLPEIMAGLTLGLFFGLMPCGLLYPMLLSAAQTGAPLEGALAMLGFGLGTVPALLAVGTLAGRVRSQSGKLLKISWLLVIALGLFNLYRHLAAWGKAACC